MVMTSAVFSAPAVCRASSREAAILKRTWPNSSSSFCSMKETSFSSRSVRFTAYTVVMGETDGISCSFGVEGFPMK